MAALLKMKEGSVSSKISYSITCDDAKSSKGIAQLEDLDFQKLNSAFRKSIGRTKGKS